VRVQYSPILDNSNLYSVHLDDCTQTYHFFNYQLLTHVQHSKVSLLIVWPDTNLVLIAGTKHKLKRRVEQTVLPSQVVESTRQGVKNVLFV